MSEITRETLEARCREWQRRLRLQDWKVTATFDTWHSLDDRSGAISYNLQHKIAKVRVMDPRHYCDHWDADDRDWENHLIHELLHLHFAPFWVMEADDKLKFEAQELAINLLTGALLDLKRRRNIYSREGDRAKPEREAGGGEG